MAKYVCTEDFSKSNLPGGKVRGRKIFVGDHPDAERCKVLVKTRTQKNWPSQRHGRFPEGYIEFTDRISFAGGWFFDLKRRTVNGKAVYIFNYCEAIDIPCRRLRAIRICRGYTEVLLREDLLVFAELVLGRVDPKLRVWPMESWARAQICQYLPALGLKDLELLVEAAKPSAEIAEPGLQLKAR